MGPRLTKVNLHIQIARSDPGLADLCVGLPIIKDKDEWSLCVGGFEIDKVGPSSGFAYGWGASKTLGHHIRCRN
jgi:hypothetical protein